jgi:hypothetical protein
VNRRFDSFQVLIPLVAALLLLAGCGDSDNSMLPPPPGAEGTEHEKSVSVDDPNAPKPDDEKKAILSSIIQLIQTASANPGGDNFTIATEQLNHYFLGADAKEFKMEHAERDYLLKRIAEKGVEDLESPRFTIRDARHIEDCLLYNTIAGRVAGDGDDLTRVKRVFDWTMRQIQLVPAGSLAPPSSDPARPIPQARARPYDVLLRGMATEDGDWAERSWLFMALCRQLGVDVGMVLYPPRPQSLLAPKSSGPPRDLAWICAALVDGKAYLFDARIGMAIPGPGGRGIATLDDVATDPSILANLDIPGRSRYGTTSDDVNRGKLKISMDSTIGYLTPRMRELQKNLAGRHRMTLFRDPAEQAAAFRDALGVKFGAAELWTMPLEVEFSLFNNPSFVTATQYAIQLFDAKLPLLHARMEQLRGNTPVAIEKYVSFLHADNAVMNDGKTPIPRPVQEALDKYATYFLGLAKLDQNDATGAEFFFNETVRLLPPPAPNQPYFNMYRWGAESNLGRLNDAKGSKALAIRYYSIPKPTWQEHGDLLRARALIWQNPFQQESAPVQESTSGEQTTASTPQR